QSHGILVVPNRGRRGIAAQHAAGVGEVERLVAAPAHQVGVESQRQLVVGAHAHAEAVHVGQRQAGPDAQLVAGLIHDAHVVAHFVVGLARELGVRDSAILALNRDVALQVHVAVGQHYQARANTQLGRDGVGSRELPEHRAQVDVGERVAARPALAVVQLAAEGRVHAHAYLKLIADAVARVAIKGKDVLVLERLLRAATIGAKRDARHGHIEAALHAVVGHEHKCAGVVELRRLVERTGSGRQQCSSGEE
nr:hypothetical protein [Tanacetum cinerariifolium]